MPESKEKNWVCNPREMKKTQGAYLIEGLAKTLLSDPSIIHRTREEFIRPIPNLSSLFESKQRHTKRSIIKGVMGVSIILCLIVAGIAVFKVNVPSTQLELFIADISKMYYPIIGIAIFMIMGILLGIGAYLAIK